MSGSNSSDRASQVLAAIFESAVDAIVVIDARGLIEAFNPAAERLFGYNEHDVLGRNVNMLMPQPYRDGHDGYLARYRRTGEARIIGVGREVQGLKRDGSTFPVHLSVGEMEVDGDINTRASCTISPRAWHWRRGSGRARSGGGRLSNPRLTQSS